MDARGRVSRIANLSGGSPTNYATNSYDLADCLVERLFGNGMKLKREYDGDDRVTREFPFALEVGRWSERLEEFAKMCRRESLPLRFFFSRQAANA